MCDVVDERALCEAESESPAAAAPRPLRRGILLVAASGLMLMALVTFAARRHRVDVTPRSAEAAMKDQKVNLWSNAQCSSCGTCACEWAQESNACSAETPDSTCCWSCCCGQQHDEWPRSGLAPVTSGGETYNGHIAEPQAYVREIYNGQAQLAQTYNAQAQPAQTYNAQARAEPEAYGRETYNGQVQTYNAPQAYGRETVTRETYNGQAQTYNAQARAEPGAPSWWEAHKGKFYEVLFDADVIAAVFGACAFIGPACLKWRSSRSEPDEEEDPMRRHRARAGRE